MSFKENFKSTLKFMGFFTLVFTLFPSFNNLFSFMIKVILYLALVMFGTIFIAKVIDTIFNWIDSKNEEWIKQYFDIKYSANNNIKDITKDARINYYALSHNKKRTFYSFLYLVWFNKMSSFIILVMIICFIAILWLFLG